MVVALIAAGLAIILGQLGVFNIAHGEFFAIGGYGVLVAQRMEQDYWIGLLVGVSAAAIVGALVHVLVIRSLLDQLVFTLLATWGIGLVIQQLLTIRFGPQPHRVDGPVRGTLTFFGITYPTIRLLTMAVALAVIVALAIVLSRSRFGIVSRAVAENRQMASILGLRSRRYDASMFALGTATAGLAGAIAAPAIAVQPLMGVQYIVVSFLVVIATGLRVVRKNLSALLLGSILFGGTFIVLTYSVSIPAAQVLAFSAAIVALLIRPEGVLSGRSPEARRH